MDIAALVAQWLMEKHANDQQKVLQELVTIVAGISRDLPEFQSWLTGKRSQLLAHATPEALDAAKIAQEQRLAAELALVEEAQNGRA